MLYLYSMVWYKNYSRYNIVVHVLTITVTKTHFSKAFWLLVNQTVTTEQFA